VAVARRALTPEEQATVDRGLRAMAQLDALATAMPTAVMRCWHRAAPRTSQLAAVRRALAGGLMTVLVSGGNRSGKTRLGALVSVLYVLGRDHPAVTMWATLNGVDVSAIQRGPGRVCASSLSWGESVEILRPAIEALMPADTYKWSGGKASTHAQVKLVTSRGGAILFKCAEQGEGRYQSDAWDLLWCDEEHPKAVFDEARARLVDRRGRAILTMTPLRGRTWVWRQFVHDPEPRSVVAHLNVRDNPYLSGEYVDAWLAMYGSHERAARERGEFTALEGRVYEFRRDLHTCAAFPVPLDWPRFQVWDFGTRNPTCVLWLAQQPGDDVLYVYREHYRAGWTIRQHGEHVNAVERCPTCQGESVAHVDGCRRRLWLSDHPAELEWVRQGAGSLLPRTVPRCMCPACSTCEAHPGRSEPEPEWRLADPSGLGERRSLDEEHGITTTKAIKDVRGGVNAVAERLAPDAAGRPHLIVMESCPNVVNEFESYLWDTSRSKGDQADKPLKANDHAMDCLSYACLYLARGHGGGFEAVGGGELAAGQRRQGRAG